MYCAFAKCCWVAREIYGQNNIKWILFREWLLMKSPKLLRSIYLKYGESFSKFIKNKPLLKKIIKIFMESRVKEIKDYLLLID